MRIHPLHRVTNVKIADQALLVPRRRRLGRRLPFQSGQSQPSPHGEDRWHSRMWGLPAREGIVGEEKILIGMRFPSVASNGSL